MLLDGIHVPLTTPFYPDGRLNLRKLEHNVDRFSRTPAAGLLLLGPQGEATTLSDAETREAITIAIAAAAPEKVMLAAIARDGLLNLLDHLDHATTAGYDAALIAPPSTLTPTQTREAITFLQAAADRSPLPLILYRTPLEVIVQVAHHPRILAAIETSGSDSAIQTLKQSTTNIRHTATVTTIFTAVTGRMLKQVASPAPGASGFVGVESLQSGGTAVATAPPPTASNLKIRTRETGFQILTTSTAGILEALRAGATGAIPTLAACTPQACYEVLAGFKDGDLSLAEEKQNRLLAAAARMEQLGIPALKFAADLNGYFGGHPRLPLLPLSAQEKLEIESLMQPMRN